MEKERLQKSSKLISIKDYFKNSEASNKNIRLLLSWISI